MVSAGLGSFRVHEPFAVGLEGLRLGTAEWVAADTTLRWHFGNSVGQLILVCQDSESQRLGRISGCTKESSA
jgi:hypothetical protein